MLVLGDAKVIDNWDAQLSGPVILYDGFCNLCNSSVAFVLRHDAEARFKFLALQSEKADCLRRDCDHSLSLDETFILIDRGFCYTRSDAVLKVLGLLPGFWPILSWLRLIPKFIRDRVYTLIARNRFNWFGRRGTCMLSLDGYQNRFLD